MKSIFVALFTAFLLCNCAADSHEATTASRLKGDASLTRAVPRAELSDCIPNIGAACGADLDCVQCANVGRHFGLGNVVVTTAVQCVNSVCMRTGCPTDPCPSGQSCQGCVLNLPCRCVDNSTPAAGLGL
jgi:hypothetical protein